MNLLRDGYEIHENIYSELEIAQLNELICRLSIERKFGVREFLIGKSKLQETLFTQKLKEIANNLSENCRVIKSIYFDKPPNANWIVNWHQDLTINVIGETQKKGYKNWRKLKDRVVVQPPIEILENIFTIRIHLDDCNEKNGALRIIRRSHKNGVIDLREGIGEFKMDEKICKVKKGGILIMKPLALHSSKRTQNNENRRVIHIEFSNIELPLGLSWKESIAL